jgi:hypothetical protein
MPSFLEEEVLGQQQMALVEMAAIPHSIPAPLLAAAVVVTITTMPV